MVAALGVSATPATRSIQQPKAPQSPVFTATANFVQTDVIVRDSRGRLVPGLTTADFVVYEDDVRQQIAVFRPYVGGRDMSVGTAGRTAPPSGFILPPRAAADTTGRVFVIFIDDLNFTFRSTSQVREIMRLIKTVVQEEDVVSIVSSGYSSIAVNPVHDYGYRHLEEAIRKTAGSGMDSRQILTAASTSQGPAGLRYMAHTAMRAANGILEQLARFSGVRKAFLYISEGYNFNPYEESRLKIEQERYGLRPAQPPTDGRGDPPGTQSPFTKPGQIFAEADLVADLAELIRNANRANVTFYTIDPRGLVAGPDIDESVSITEHRNHVRTSIDSLKAIAHNTGGICLCETNDFKGGLERINNETSDYYMLGYNSTNRDPMHRRRIVRVEMTKPGLTLMYRTEYTIPARR
jgi:VWFA-related protein